MTLAKRPSTIAIVAAIMRRYPQLEIVPHVICGGASRSKVESELLDLHFLGIQNVVALRGDAIPGQRFFIPEADGFSHSSELVGLIHDLNQGKYLDPTVKNGLSTDFCVGVAAYPEKHYEAANLDTDINNLKQKVKVLVHVNGADGDEKELREYKVEELKFRPKKPRRDSKDDAAEKALRELE